MFDLRSRPISALAAKLLPYRDRGSFCSQLLKIALWLIANLKEEINLFMTKHDYRD